MLAEERREQIQGLLKSYNSLSIKDLANKFSVSASTIRRDLQRLEKKKLLRRTHGGAVSSKLIKKELNFNMKKEVNVEDKKKIAILASDLISNGDTIFIESGSTCIQLCFNLANKRNLTIITNSCDIALAANMANPETKIFLTGGFMKPDTHSLIGHLAESSLQQFKIEKAFIGITAIDIKEGITTVDYTEAYTKRQIINAAKVSIGLADNSKFNKVCLNYVCPVEDVGMIVTDTNTDSALIERIREIGIQVFI